MRKRLINLCVAASWLVAACGPTQTQAPTPGSTAGPTTAATAQPIPPDLTKTDYKAEPVGKRGGTILRPRGGCNSDKHEENNFGCKLHRIPHTWLTRSQHHI